MNFNKIIRNELKNVEKSRRCTCKITHIPVAKCPRVPNLVLNKCLDTACLPNDTIYKNILILLSMNIDENMRNNYIEGSGSATIK